MRQTGMTRYITFVVVADTTHLAQSHKYTAPYNLKARVEPTQKRPYILTAFLPLDTAYSALRALLDPRLFGFVHSIPNSLSTTRCSAAISFLLPLVSSVMRIIFQRGAYIKAYQSPSRSPSPTSSGAFTRYQAVVNIPPTRRFDRGFFFRV